MMTARRPIPRWRPSAYCGPVAAVSTVTIVSTLPLASPTRATSATFREEQTVDHATARSPVRRRPTQRRIAGVPRPWARGGPRVLFGSHGSVAGGAGSQIPPGRDRAPALAGHRGHGGVR